MRLETDRITIADVSPEQLHAELARLGEDNGRAILSADDTTYIQTAVFDNGFVIERRDGGGEDTHFHAVPRHAELPPPAPRPERRWWEKLLLSDNILTSECAFTLEQVQRIFADYLAGRQSDIPRQWDQGFCDR
ncbi:hypothetical protein [Aurantiacibacter gangjinensis]|uniref:Uncharacterized protein n=1 Tax=Aurantiacibacter gangjinensis TaxID=502682 RepID=A0A0G9MME6_9SPHN|nr:hypothetical protein [Aurantiacibacter gangjinensis]APE27962.1 hypothetical protein BMF35_a1133 [Aurantiacibacter gangjinensis]KLE31906.1 hypothetical protein AAW01_10670 [Aurantiacibacter gangjinensis]